MHHTGKAVQRSFIGWEFRNIRLRLGKRICSKGRERPKWGLMGVEAFHHEALVALFILECRAPAIGTGVLLAEST